MAYSGEDLIYTFTLTDSAGTAINFADVTDMSVQFKSSKGVIISKTKVDLQVVQGDTSNSYDVELQETETAKLGKGQIFLTVLFTVTDADFSDGEATSIVKDKIILL